MKLNRNAHRERDGLKGKQCSCRFSIKIEYVLSINLKYILSTCAVAICPLSISMIITICHLLANRLPGYFSSF